MSSKSSDPRTPTFAHITQLANIEAHPAQENPSEHVNFQAFAANLDERRIFRTDPTWAIWAMREAFEKLQQKEEPDGDTCVLSAAQWILWYGQSLFKQVLYPCDTPDDLRPWNPGPLYRGKAELSLHRWHFWKNGFKAVASSRTGEEKAHGWRDHFKAAASGGKEKGSYSQECIKVAAKAASIMDSLEENMTF